MAGPAANIEASVISMAVKIDGQELPGNFMIKGLDVTYQVNRIPMAQVIIAENTDIANYVFDIDDSKFDPGKEIEIKMGYGAINETIFKGIIVKNSLKVRSGDAADIVLDCRDKLVKLTLDKKNKVYKDSKDSDAISAIISEGGLTANVDATTITHKQLHKHRCTDWDFIMNRAEVCGMYLFPAVDGVKIAKPEFGNAVLAIEYGVSLISADLELDARNQFTDVASYGWDAAKMQKVAGASSEPTVNTQGSISSSTLGNVLGSPYKQYASGSKTKDEMDLWSTARLTRARLSRIQGTVSFYGNSKPKVGDVIDLTKISNKFSGGGYVGGVNHHVAEGEWETTITLGLSNLPYYEEQHTGDMPAGGHMPAINGLHIGLVTKLDQDPDGIFRIGVKMAVAESDDVEIWARLSTFYASNEMGTFFYPEINDEVIVGFVNDDPQDAIVLGSVYGKNKTPYPPAAENNTKGIVTRTKMKLTFDEEKKVITVETPGGNSIVLDDDKKSITLTDANNNKVTLDDKGISMETQKDVKIKATGKVAIEGTGGVEIKSSADVKVEGLNVNVNANVGAVVKGSATAELSASGQTTVKGAMVMIN